MNKLYQNLVRTGLNDTESGNYIYYEDEIKKLMKWCQVDEIRLSYLLVKLRNDKRVADVEHYYDNNYLVIDVVFYLDYIKGENDMSKPKLCLKDTRNKFERWDDQVAQWYHTLGMKSKFKFWLIFPFMFIADGLLIPVRGINKLMKRGKRRV